MPSGVLRWENLVGKLLFIVVSIRHRSRQSISEEVEFRMLIDYPDSEPDDDSDEQAVEAEHRGRQSMVEGEEAAEAATKRPRIEAAPLAAAPSQSSPPSRLDGRDLFGGGLSGGAALIIGYAIATAREELAAGGGAGPVRAGGPDSQPDAAAGVPPAAAPPRAAAPADQEPPVQQQAEEPGRR